MNLFTKQKQTHRHREQTCGCQVGRGMDWEFGVSRCKLLYTEWINNKVLLYSTGNYIQYPVINHNRKEKKEFLLIISRNSQWVPHICICIFLVFFCLFWFPHLMFSAPHKAFPHCCHHRGCCAQSVLQPPLPWGSHASPGRWPVTDL